MRRYRLIIHDRVFDQISEIQNFIASLNTYEAAKNYSKKLFDEIESLKHRADVMQFSRWKVAKKYHPKAKRLITKNRKWNIIFHIDGSFVVIDSILPSSTMR